MYDGSLKFDLSHLYRWRRGWCHLWHPDTDRGWHDVLINDGNQVLSLREVTHGWHHYVRTSDITAPAPALVTGIITRPDVIITWSLGHLHFISLTSVCSGARLPRLQDTNRKSSVICIKQHMQHFGEQFGVKCSERERGRWSRSIMASQQLNSPASAAWAAAGWFATN